MPVAPSPFNPLVELIRYRKKDSFSLGRCMGPTHYVTLAFTIPLCSVCLSVCLSLSLSLFPRVSMCAHARARVCICVRVRACMCAGAHFGVYDVYGVCVGARARVCVLTRE